MFLISNTRNSFKLSIFFNPLAVKLFEFNCNFVTKVKLLEIAITPKSPILFSPKINDFRPLNEASCRISSSEISSFGRSTSSVYYVMVVCWMVTRANGLVATAYCSDPADYSWIYSFNEMSRMADSSLVLASESYFELRSSPVSTWACLANSCLIY